MLGTSCAAATVLVAATEARLLLMCALMPWPLAQLLVASQGHTAQLAAVDLAVRRLRSDMSKKFECAARHCSDVPIFHRRDYRGEA